MTALEIVLIIAIILFLGGIVAWRVLVHVRKRKNGGASGGCGSCGGCAAAGSCPAAKAAKAAKAEREGDGEMHESVQTTVTCDFSDIVAKLRDDADNKAD